MMAGGDSGSGDKRPFEAFYSRFGSPTPQRGSNSEILNSLTPGFPDLLRDYWRQRGFGAYADRLIWTHSPGEFEAVVDEWTGMSLKKAALLVRFSFGDFVISARGRTYFVNVHRGYVEELLPDVGFLFDEMLCDDVYLDNFLRRPLHAACSRTLGALSADECFAFVPALALGGTESLDAVRRVPMREHLAFLAQVNGPVSIF